MKKLSLLIFALGMFFVSCEKDQDAIISSLKIENEKLTPSYTSILVECQLSSKATLRNVFLQYSTSVDFSEYEEIKMKDKTKGNYSANIIGLRDNTIYYIRYAASNTYSSILAEEFSSVTTLEQEVPTLHIDSVLLILDTLATVQFVIDFDGGDSITQTGICWSTETSPTIEKKYIDAPNNDSIVSLCKLQANTIYYVRAYAKNSIGMAYSEEIMFTTLALPEVETNDITDIQLTSALLHGTLLFNGNDTATIKGFCWSEGAEPTINDEHILIDTIENTFSYLLSNLKDETRYYVRAYAQNKIGISYGDVITFMTASAMVPTVSTMNVYDIDYHSAKVRVNVISDGGADVTERGLYYSIQDTLVYIHYPGDTGTGEFTMIMTNLTDSTIYNVRAYAVNKKGYGYGEPLSFMTKGYEYPTVTTSAPTNISYTSATVGGDVASAGGAEITERGICYATTQNPTINDTKIRTTKGIGSFSIDLTNLTDTTIYYVRAYAINRKGISYGEQMSFTTKGYKIPMIKTFAPTNISYASVTVGGEVIDDGGLEISEHGVCYSLTLNPTVEDMKVISDEELGAFSIDLTGLSDSATYYVRAYAINDKGIGYGENVSFTTKKYNLPTVTTTIPTNISYTSATVGGTIISNGGFEIIEQGICYATSTNPTVSEGKIIAESSSNTFVVNLVGLPNGATYYVRAYAINNKGISYGNEVSFTTLAYFGEENGHQWVDLGLSVKWATMNIGASSSTAAGSSFAWGEVEPKTIYNWSTYKWCNGLPTTLTKYNTDSVNGFVDNKTVLELSDDAAAVNWGSDWRMPTEAEINELLTKCTWSKSSQFWKVIGPNGNSILIPIGNYWSNSLLVSATSRSYMMWLYNYNYNDYDLRTMERCLGAYIRPVRP